MAKIFAILLRKGLLNPKTSTKIINDITLILTAIIPAIKKRIF
jgi:hypothetical protein